MYTFIKKQATLLSVFVALSFIGHFPGIQGYPPEASAYSSAISSQDQRYFSAIKREQEYKNIHIALREKERITQKIIHVLSSYSTGLDGESLENIPQWIYDESQKYDYDPLLLTALIVTESSFNNWAKSHRGALGLMQIRPRTGHAMATEVNLPWEGKPTLFEPESNIALGTYYLSKLQTRFNNDVKLALEAYNHGPTKLQRYIQQGKLPEDYSNKVLKIYDLIRSNNV